MRAARLLGLLLVFMPALARASADISNVQGLVEVKRGFSWERVRIAARVNDGESVRTGEQSSAKLEFPDASIIELGPNSVFQIKVAQRSLIQMILQLGSLRATVTKHLARQFSVQTPVAVCSVRGTEFLVDVDTKKQSNVQVVEGVVAVKTLLGEEVEIGDGRATRSLRIVPDRPLEIPVQRAGGGKQTSVKPSATVEGGRIGQMAAAEGFKHDVEREVALGLSKDAVQAAAAIEARRAEYQEGKTLVDVSGHRVRLEQYIVRPAADTFKFVALNERDNSLNYFYYQAQFNQTLPAQLAPALEFLNGKTGTAPQFFITAFETGRSNSQDSIKENGTAGHLVNSPLAQDTVIYDPTQNAFTTVKAGTAFWSTLFDNYSYKVNGAEKFGWQPNAGPGVTSYDYVAAGINTRILGGGALCGAAGCATAAPVTCTSLTCEQAARPSVVTNPDGAGSMHQRVTITYAATGQSEVYDFYIADDAGRVATQADFNNVTNGDAYKATLVKFNYEQVISEPEFNGRVIDLTISPKILIQSGVIQ